MQRFTISILLFKMPWVLMTIIRLRSMLEEVRAVCEAAALRFADCGTSVEADCIDFRDARDTFQTLRQVV